MHSERNLIHMMPAKKSQENQQNISYRITLAQLSYPCNVLLFLKSKRSPLRKNIREIHIQLIKTLTGFIKSNEEGKYQELKPYHYLTDLEIALT